MTYAEMAEDVRDTLRWLGVPQVGLIGHSMGGKTAMQCALSFPECVSRLMVADISPRAYEPKHVRILEALLRLEPSCAVNRTEMERALEADVPDLAVRRFLLKDLKVKEGVYAWQMNLPAIAVCYSGLNQEIHGEPSAIPACFVAGEQSDYLKAGDRPCIQRLFPRAVFENVAGAGHWLHAEQPRRFLEIVTKFFG
jgi:pimeloyl-ACP methyl ester carboxylesterase